MDGLFSWIALIAIFAAGIAASRGRWGMAALSIVSGGVLIAVFEDSGGTIVPLGEYLWEAALGGLGLK